MLDGELNRDAASAFSSGPTGHGGEWRVCASYPYQTAGNAVGYGGSRTKPPPGGPAAACPITCTAVTPTNDWITDRRPTEADGDKHGNVVILHYHFHAHQPWYVVGHGPWRRSDSWQPPAAPDPAPTKPALAVGQRWRRRDGALVTVGLDSGGDFVAGGLYYTSNGTAPFSASPGSMLELIELLPTPTPTLAPRKFASIKRTITNVGHIIDAIDEDGVAWCMAVGSDSLEPEWIQLLPLPGREVLG